MMSESINKVIKENYSVVFSDKDGGYIVENEQKERLAIVVKYEDSNGNSVEDADKDSDIPMAQIKVMMKNMQNPDETFSFSSSAKQGIKNESLQNLLLSNLKMVANGFKKDGKYQRFLDAAKEGIGVQYECHRRPTDVIYAEAEQKAVIARKLREMLRAIFKSERRTLKDMQNMANSQKEIRRVAEKKFVQKIIGILNEHGINRDTLQKELGQDSINSEYIASKVGKAVMKILNPDNQSDKSKVNTNYDIYKKEYGGNNK